MAQETKNIKSDCEDVWVKINLFGSKSLLIGAYYKPHEFDHPSSTKFAKSQNKATELNCNQIPRNIPLYRKADWEGIQKHSHPTIKKCS